MYLPKRFQNENIEDVLALIKKYPLATLISTDQNKPFISHIPLVVEQASNDLILIGHLARANPHWKLLEGQPVYGIFNGPDAYISPKWYAKNDVPTWNYAVVHIEGQCSLVENHDGILSCVKKLSTFAESASLNPWEFWIPDDLAADGILEKSIVGIQIKVTSIKAKFKLNQSRTEADLHGVVNELKTHESENDRELAELMNTAWKAYNH